MMGGPSVMSRMAGLVLTIIGGGSVETFTSRARTRDGSRYASTRSSAIASVFAGSNFSVSAAQLLRLLLGLARDPEAHDFRPFHEPLSDVLDARVGLGLPVHSGKRFLCALFRLNLDRRTRLENIEIFPVVYLRLMNRDRRLAVRVQARPAKILGNLRALSRLFLRLAGLRGGRLAKKLASKQQQSERMLALSVFITISIGSDS